MSDNRRDRDAYSSPNTALGGPADGELVLKAAGKIITGWKAVSLTRSVESIPSRFDIRATAKNPGGVADIVPRNSALTIEIGGKTVLTGYLEQIVPVLGAEEHELRYAGRGRCCDIVDCAALISNQTATMTSLIRLAKDMIQPFAGPIQVVTPDGEGDGKPFTFSPNLGETVYESLERLARFEGLLVYENADGNLVLSRVGKVKHASGFAEGKNIQSAEFVTDMSQRFSKYDAFIIAQDTLSRTGGNAESFGSFRGQALDPDVDRYRPRVIISEQANTDGELALQRARWEAQRRKGRSFRVDLVADSWLDSAGTPWTPNQVAPVSIPSLGVNEPGWVITDVRYRRDDRSGTTVQVTLMPPEALTVEPVGQDSISLRAQNPTGTPTATPPTGPSAPNALPSVASDGRPVSVTQGAGI